MGLDREMQELIEKALAQVVEDVQHGDITAIEVILEYVPEEVLQSFLSEVGVER